MIDKIYKKNIIILLKLHYNRVVIQNDKITAIS